MPQLKKFKRPSVEQVRKDIAETLDTWMKIRFGAYLQKLINTAQRRLTWAVYVDHQFIRKNFVFMAGETDAGIMKELEQVWYAALFNAGETPPSLEMAAIVKAIQRKYPELVEIGRTLNALHEINGYWWGELRPTIRPSKSRSASTRKG